MENIEKLTKRIIEFRDARDWAQFHNPKDVALSLILEAGELAEHFQWRNKEEIEEHLSKNKNDVGEEIADVLYWVLLLSHDLRIDPLKALERKLLLNEKKYPVSKAKGNHKKYTEL